jgi:hypothetical protein
MHLVCVVEVLAHNCLLAGLNDKGIKTRNIHINVKPMRVRVTIVAVEEQLVLELCALLAFHAV